VLDIAESEPRVRDPVAALPAPSRRPTFALEGVAAAYSPDQPNVLHGVSLTLRPGAKLALVGTSGSGKTTIVNLLLRFLDPVEGRVTLDGRDLRVPAGRTFAARRRGAGLPIVRHNDP
jgi:ABC-type multidrug transport system fused ATPase/permease subunit